MGKEKLRFLRGGFWWFWEKKNFSERGILVVLGGFGYPPDVLGPAVLDEVFICKIEASGNLSLQHPLPRIKISHEGGAGIRG